MLKRKHLFSALLSLVSLLAFATEKSAQFEYIERYKDIAIKEMLRSQIPASITLAQAILESQWGESALATEAKNFFGIKCKSSWNGETFFIEDDDFDENNQLLQSCFRAYETVSASFTDHTNFLVQNQRYAKLFSLEKADYKGWARGLQAAGYATDPHYADKLIEKVEQYNLQQYDTSRQAVNVLEAPAFDLADLVQSETQPQSLSVSQIMENHREDLLIQQNNYNSDDKQERLHVKFKRSNYATMGKKPRILNRTRK